MSWIRCAGGSSRNAGLAAAAAAVELARKQTRPPIGPLRSPPRWDQAGRVSTHIGSAARWEEGKELRDQEFGSSKQWKTLSMFEAMDKYCLLERDLVDLPYVAKYNVYGTARISKFFVVFDVQDRALARWGSAKALKETRQARQLKLKRRQARKRIRNRIE